MTAFLSRLYVGAKETTISIARQNFAAILAGLAVVITDLVGMQALRFVLLRCIRIADRANTFNLVGILQCAFVTPVNTFEGSRQLEANSCFVQGIRE